MCLVRVYDGAITEPLTGRPRVPASGSGGISQGSALDVRELLQLIAERQASLGKLRQLVVENVLAHSQPDSIYASLSGFKSGRTEPAVRSRLPLTEFDVRQRNRDTLSHGDQGS